MTTLITMWVCVSLVGCASLPETEPVIVFDTGEVFVELDSVNLIYRVKSSEPFKLIPDNLNEQVLNKGYNVYLVDFFNDLPDTELKYDDFETVSSYIDFMVEFDSFDQVTSVPRFNLNLTRSNELVASTTSLFIGDKHLIRIPFSSSTTSNATLNIEEVFRDGLSSDEIINQPFFNTNTYFVFVPFMELEDGTVIINRLDNYKPIKTKFNYPNSF